MTDKGARRDVEAAGPRLSRRRPRRTPRRSDAAKSAEPQSRATILFLAANPSGATHLQLDEEARYILARLQAAEYRDAFSFQSRWAVRADDLQQALLEEKPVIVHFSGHGYGARGLALTGATGDAVPVATEALRDLFSILRDRIRVVVLNACYAAEQADAIAEEIDAVIGMAGAGDDRGARIFSAAFYRALGFGRSVGAAFDLGVNALKLEGFRRDSELLELRTRAGVDPDGIVLALSDSPRSWRRIGMFAGAMAALAGAALAAIPSLRGSQDPAITYDYLKLDHDGMAQLLEASSGARVPALRGLELAETPAGAGGGGLSAATFRAIHQAAKQEPVHDQEYFVLRIVNTGDAAVREVSIKAAELEFPLRIRDLGPHEAVALPVRVQGRHAVLATQPRLTVTTAYESFDHGTKTVSLPVLDELVFRGKLTTGIWRGAPP